MAYECRPVGPADNRWLKWILIEIVQTLKLAPGPVGTYYQRLARGKGKAKATVAAVRKLCCYLYWMLKEGWSYAEWLLQHEPPPSNHASVSSDVEAREDDFGRSWKRRRATLRIAPR